MLCLLRRWIGGMVVEHLCVFGGFFLLDEVKVGACEYLS